MIIDVGVAYSLTHSDRLGQMIEYDYSDGHLFTREEFCAVAAKVFLAEYMRNDMPTEVNLPFDDMEQIKTENLRYIEAMYASGVLKGAEDNGKLYMRPRLNITRQEAVTMLGRLLEIDSDNFENTAEVLWFGDANQIADYAYGYVAWFTERSIITGHTDGTFRPRGNINAVEFAALSVRAYDFSRLNNNKITTLSGTGGRGYFDEKNENTRFIMPYGTVINADGRVIVFDTFNNLVRVIDSGNTRTVTGSIADVDENRFPTGYYMDADLKDALLNRPTVGVINSSGDILLADSANNVIRLIRDGKVYTWSGTTNGYRDGERNRAQFKPSHGSCD